MLVEHQLDLLAQRDGTISKLAADVGARVKMGDALAEMDDRQLMADMDVARSKAKSAEADLKGWQSEEKVLDADYDRAKKLWDAQLIPLEQFDHVRFKSEEEHFEVQRAEQSLAAARQRSNRSRWSWRRLAYMLLSLVSFLDDTFETDNRSRAETDSSGSRAMVRSACVSPCRRSLSARSKKGCE